MKWNNMEDIEYHEDYEDLFITHYKKWQTKITIPRGKINSLLKWVMCDIDRILWN